MDTSRERRGSPSCSEERPLSIYLAGPLFSAAERGWNAEVAVELQRYGYETILPQAGESRLLGRSSEEVSPGQALFQRDLAEIDFCDVIVACMDGADPDAGTCWECGYAFRAGKRVVVYRTDMRDLRDISDAPFNLMVACSSEVVSFDHGSAVVSG